MRQDVSEILDFSRLELWRQAKTHGDLQTWAAFQQSLEGTVLTWFHEHPGSEAVCRVNSERHFVSLAFGRLRQAVVQGQVVCETLSEVLVLPACESEWSHPGALRVSTRPGAVSSLWPEGEDRPDRSEFWDRLQRSSPANVSVDWPTCSITVDWNPPRLCEALHRNGAMSTRVARLRRIIVAQLMKEPNFVSNKSSLTTWSLGPVTPSARSSPLRTERSEPQEERMKRFHLSKLTFMLASLLSSC